MNKSNSTQALTRHAHYPIDISVQTRFIPEQSEPHNQRFVFAYTITVKNVGPETAQLLARHWLITDADGGQQEVRGQGVVGEQPVLYSGAEYTYTSGVVLETETGTMEGSDRMRNENDELYEAEIPTFALVPPHAMH